MLLYLCWNKTTSAIETPSKKATSAPFRRRILSLRVSSQVLEEKVKPH